MIDTWLLNDVASHRTAWATALARGLMAAGTDRRVLVAVLLGAIALVCLRRTRAMVAAAVVAAALSLILADTLKLVIGRPRPPASLALVHATGPSMPSTVAASTAAVATVLVATAAVARRRGGVLPLALSIVVGGTVLVGAALVYLGAHWPADVLAGWALGGIVGATAAAAFGLSPLTSAAR